MSRAERRKRADNKRVNYAEKLIRAYSDAMVEGQKADDKDYGDSRARNRIQQMAEQLTKKAPQEKSIVVDALRVAVKFINNEIKMSQMQENSNAKG